MKTFLMILFVIPVLTACQSSDSKTSGKSLTTEEKTNEAKDPSNLTTIQWLDSTFRDFGKVKKGRVVDVAFRFKNSGNNPLIISEVSGSCGCTVPEKPEEPIAAGEEGVIKARFDSKNQHLGENRKTVTVTANTTPSQTTQLIFRVDLTD